LYNYYRYITIPKLKFHYKPIKLNSYKLTFKKKIERTYKLVISLILYMDDQSQNNIINHASELNYPSKLLTNFAMPT